MAMITLTIGSIFILVGLFIGLLVARKAIKALQSNRWPATTGHLEQAGWRKVVTETTKRDWAAGGATDFRYRYSVDGNSYAGERVTFSDSTSKTSGSLNKLVDQYRHQKDIVVYYNPQDPSESVLVPGANWYNFAPLITAAAFVGFGAFIAFGGMFGR